MITDRILIWCKILFITFVEGTINLVYGLVFLVRHPITFNKFVGEYRGWKQKIDDNDEAITAGYYELTREQRRRLKRRIK